MKFLSLISATLFALNIAGAVQAEPAAPVHRDNVAPATIVLAHCEAGDTAACSMDAPGAKTSESDQTALSSAQQVQAQDLATPVPEPEISVMLMLGLVVLGFASRRNSASDKFTD